MPDTTEPADDDAVASLARKLIDLRSGLTQEEDELFSALLLVAATADQGGDVEGFGPRFRPGTARPGGGGDLQMIQLQSLVSQRQQAVQLSTNLLQGMDATSHGIIHNIGD